MRKHAIEANSKGFTLIELLVVIAIIGILSSVVLASLNAARDKSKDAVVKSELSSIRSSAELEYSNIRSYNQTGSAIDSQTCSNLATANSIFQSTNIQNALKDMKKKTGQESSCHVNAAGTAYAISAPLVAVTGHWCIDNIGHSTTTSNGTALANGATVCP